MIDRPRYVHMVASLFEVFPVVAILGPRQCGKTTLARMYTQGREAGYFDLEHPTDRARLGSPLTELERLSGLIVIDEIQQIPALFEILRVVVDRPGNASRYLVLGSASPDIIRGVSETLAGRIGFVDLAGFSLGEVGHAEVRTLWQRGGFPLSYLATSDEASDQWREQFVRTFLERDIAQLGFPLPGDTARRFWTMVAHFHGQAWNAAEFARSLGSSEGTARKYLDILCGCYMVRRLMPWHVNLRKRQVKAPKIYVRDSGLLHSLLSIPDMTVLTGHPKLGASWKGFVIEQIIAGLRTRDAYYWRTQNGAELDLMIQHRGQRLGFEIKYSDAPTTTRSMHVAMTDLDLSHLYVIYPGRESYQLGPAITVLPLPSLLAELGTP